MCRFLCKVDHDSNEFIHAPMESYNELMLLELVNVVSVSNIARVVFN